MYRVLSRRDCKLYLAVVEGLRLAKIAAIDVDIAIVGHNLNRQAGLRCVMGSIRHVPCGCGVRVMVIDPFLHNDRAIGAMHV